MLENQGLTWGQMPGWNAALGQPMGELYLPLMATLTQQAGQPGALMPFWQAGLSEERVQSLAQGLAMFNATRGDWSSARPLSQLSNQMGPAYDQVNVDGSMMDAAGAPWMEYVGQRQAMEQEQWLGQAQATWSGLAQAGQAGGARAGAIATRLTGSPGVGPGAMGYARQRGKLLANRIGELARLGLQFPELMPMIRLESEHLTTEMIQAGGQAEAMERQAGLGVAQERLAIGDFPTGMSRAQLREQGYGGQIGLGFAETALQRAALGGASTTGEAQRLLQLLEKQAATLDDIAANTKNLSPEERARYELQAEQTRMAAVQQAATYTMPGQLQLGLAGAQAAVNLAGLFPFFGGPMAQAGGIEKGMGYMGAAMQDYQQQYAQQRMELPAEDRRDADTQFQMNMLNMTQQYMGMFSRLAENLPARMLSYIEGAAPEAAGSLIRASTLRGIVGMQDTESMPSWAQMFFGKNAGFANEGQRDQFLGRVPGLLATGPGGGMATWDPGNPALGLEGAGMKFDSATDKFNFGVDRFLVGLGLAPSPQAAAGFLGAETYGERLPAEILPEELALPRLARPHAAPANAGGRGYHRDDPYVPMTEAERYGYVAGRWAGGTESDRADYRNRAMQEGIQRREHLTIEVQVNGQLLGGGSLADQKAQIQQAVADATGQYLDSRF